MSFYDLRKDERADLVKKMHLKVNNALKNNTKSTLIHYFSDEDTYIRKSAYLIFGRIYKTETNLQVIILEMLDELFGSKDFKVRQTVVNAAGEIGMTDFSRVKVFFDKGLFDAHHSVRNAVIGSIKKMSQKNSKPVLTWAKSYLHHTDKEIRREICHGIELRGRTHPEDILPLLKELQYDETSRVSKTLVHVLGQIAYKKDCLAKVITALSTWKNKKLVQEAVAEIVDVHWRYRDFTVLTQKQAIAYINKNLTTN